MTKQWDKYREIIIAEYKDHNKPLREVQRVMLEKYGFRASFPIVTWFFFPSAPFPTPFPGIQKDLLNQKTRAYRSRFDRWGVHKYSRRRRLRSTSPGRRESFCDGAAPDDDDSNSQAASPPDTTPMELLTPGLCVASPEMGFRR
ncbi:Clr5 domain-containing protein [Chaetomium strumarium]|uniref:Clr5 domain-containing protein n=1 Tax=Chaetomium strumarium TaxID=1170767 RepID=A0AAJ0GP19_9PEZI|nr:Clr5 domain-containing protein [Chaetomium strumarium]